MTILRSPLLHKTLLALTVSLSVSSLADACTRAVYQGEGALVVTGRTMDLRSAMPTNLWALPRGIAREGEAGAHSILNAKGDSLRRRWEGNFAGASAPLVLNVLLDHLQRCSAARARKVRA
ncbi:hypothetical protein [Aeromonas caviae]|nr:hypothetical protein [Aeromonas caviae]MDH0317110.1 hypothetical protein [Aeromonas caviae]MDH1496467.1 hypothetical protein [Aeromonas caviae]MDX7866450.1 hypothetical protein [Aeromonas caviae]MDY7891682.1 hypothetical protein [Aeromonas caviae]